jgi:hypothetical protein
MIAANVGSDMLGRSARPGNYCVHLKVSPADREDAWDLCRVAVRYGGVEIHDGCFVFATEERWLAALDAIRFRFGPEYIDYIKSAEGLHD